MRNILTIQATPFMMAGDMATAMANAPTGRRANKAEQTAAIVEAAAATVATPTNEADRAAALFEAADAPETPDPAINDSDTFYAGLTPEQRKNRFFRLYRDPIFKASEQDKLYPSERDGSVSKKLGSVLLPFRDAAGAYDKGTVYGRQAKGHKTAVAEFSWFGAANQSSKLVEDYAAKEDRKAYFNWLQKRFVAWRTEIMQDRVEYAIDDVIVEGLNLVAVAPPAADPAAK